MKVYITERQLNLLSILEKENDAINSKQLGNLLDVSSKTIQTEIQTLNALLPNNWSIEAVYGIGYYLTQPFSESVYFRFIAKEHLLAHDALDLILKEEVTNLAELSDRLFLSISTVHKLVSDLNEAISNFYNLEIVNRPLRLVGDENSIRRLMYDMMYFMYSKFNNHEFYIIEKNEFDIFLANQIRITLSLYNKNAFYTFFDVAIKRIKEGYEAEGLPDDLIDDALSSDLYKRIEPLFAYIENTYKVHLSKKEKSIFYFALIRTDFHLIESYAPDYFDKQIDNTFCNFIDYLSSLFNLNFKNCSNFMIHSYNMYYLNYYTVDLVNKLHELDYDSFEGRDHFDSVIESHNLPIEQFSYYTNKWGYENNIKFSKDFLISILVLIQDFNLTNATLDIFVVKSHSYILNNLLLTELKRDLGNKVKFFEYEPSHQRHFNKMNQSFDFILSDIILPKHFSSTPHIYLSEYVSDKKLTFIRQTINEAIKEKEMLKINPPLKE